VAVPLAPARLRFTQQGVPYSEAFDDVYHSAAGAVGQARHVFLDGNHLTERWAGRERFVILETGFGAGINFLVTWQAWRRDATRCARLLDREASVRAGGREVDLFQSSGNPG
jgi:tRNA 5-methylaminomethyl-2-thiouridine biosynthesis bifunctional protein